MQYGEVSYFIVIIVIPQWVVQTAVLKNASIGVGQGALRMSLWKRGGGGEKVWEPLV
jgi:hypothetical protein